MCADTLIIDRLCEISGLSFFFIIRKPGSMDFVSQLVVLINIEIGVSL